MWKSGLHHSSVLTEAVIFCKFSHESDCFVGGEVGSDGGYLSSEFANSDYFFHSVLFLSFLGVPSPSFHIYYTAYRAKSQGVFEKNKKNFFQKNY